MATVYVTFFLITFYEMDAISIERKRDCNKKRLKRWSMNSQRLEEIVAELMKPISDLRHIFDTDLSTLLEEYLTEAGLRALEEEEEEVGEGCGVVDVVRPNFSELALLVQHCASVYGKKVDFLYQQVLSVSKSTHNASLELSNETPAESSTPGGSKRRRKSVGAAWGDIVLEPAPNGARREPSAVPPPTLPRLYAELQPRAITKYDVQLTDLAGEPIGLLSDFHVTQRLQDGFLMDDLECRHTALGAAAPPALPSPIPIPTIPTPTTPITPTTPLPLNHSTPIPSPAPLDITQDTLLLKKGRKRRSDVNHDMESLPESTFKLHITEELRARLALPAEFSVPGAWVAAVVAARARRLRRARCAARLADTTDRAGFRGFDCCPDAGGFAGWAECERVSSETTALQLQRLSEGGARRDTVSDDDGFFERSSLHSDDSPQHTLSRSDPGGASGAGGAGGWWESSEWLSRVAAAPARAFDVREVAARVLAALPPPAPAAPPPPPPTPFKRLLAATAHQHTDVSRIFLATLFLANAGNVEVCPEPPSPDASAHAVGSFGVRALSREPQLYTALAAAERALLPPAPPAPPAPPVS